MYSLRLTCRPEEVDLLSADLWELGTVGIREENSAAAVVLTAGFETANLAREPLKRFESYSPEWFAETDTDWVQQTQQAWPAKPVGQRLFLAPPWNQDPTPEGRIRLMHNPGLASGTGEHPCTQLALQALEELVSTNMRIWDIGTGSGILAIAASLLGASNVIAVDTDYAALLIARENLELNRLSSTTLVAGSAECLATGKADLTVANISATVLLDMLEDLLRITTPGGCLVLTGFTEAESEALSRYVPTWKVFPLNEWRCLVVRLPSVSG